MPNIGELLVSLRASTEAFSRDLDRAQQLSFNTSREIERSFKRIGGVITAELTAAVGAVTVAVGAAVEEAARMGILAHQAGLTAEQFTALAYSASLFDVSAESLTRTIIIFSKNLEKSNEATNQGKAAQAAMATLFRGSVPVFQDTNQAFLETVARLRDLAPGYQQTALTAQIFGSKIGAQLVPLINSKEGMKALADEARSLGRVMSEETVARAHEFEASMTKLEASAKALALQVGVQLLPYLKQLTDALLDLAKGSNASGASVNAIATSVKVLATAVIAVGGAFAVLGAQAAQVILLLKNAGLASVGLQASWGELAASEEQLKDAFLGTVGTIQNLWNPAVDGMNVHLADTTGKTEHLAAVNTALKKTYDDIVKRLSDEITTMTLGAAAVQQFKLQAEGATKAQLAFVDALEAMVKNLKAGKDAFTGLATTPLLDTLEGMNTTALKIDDSFGKLQEAGFRVWERSRTSLEKYSVDMANLDVLLKANVIDQETYNRVHEEEGRQLGLIHDRVSQLAPVYRELRGAIAETFTEGILHADSFVSALGRILDRLAEVILQALVLKPLFDWLGSQGGILGAIFGGARAGGGAATAGTSYLVGEHGPEIFTPAVSGYVVPNGSFGGGQTIYNIDARGADPTVEFRIRRALAETENRAVVRAVAATRESSSRTA